MAVQPLGDAWDGFRKECCAASDGSDVASLALGWLGAPALAIVNGAARELVYKDRVGESTADQISVAPLIALLALYFWFLQRQWPLGSTRDALSIGASWAALSIVFEFGFGHYVEGDSWEELIRTYDVTAGVSGS